MMGFFTALSLLLTSQVSSSWQLFITYSLLLAIGTGGMYVVLMTTVSRWFIRRRGLALGIVGTGVSSGMMVIGLLSAYLISNYGWQTAFLLIGLMALFIIVPCGLLLRRSPSEIAASPKSERLAATGYSFPEEQHQRVPDGLSLPQAVKTRNCLLVADIL